AVGAAHICLRKVDPQLVFDLLDAESISMMCAAPTILIGIANAPATMRARAPKGVRVVTAGAPPAAATIERIEQELGWTMTDGYAEVRDRIKDIIISGGENISSVEVEGVLLRHPAVQEVAIVGLPDAKWGEAPHAFVVLKPGAAATAEELRTFARDRLAHFKA